MGKNFVSFVVYRSGKLMAIGLGIFLGTVISNILVIQEIHTHTGGMGWLILIWLIMIDFSFFMCSIGAAKVMISLIVSYDDERIFKSSREEIAAERKSTMRRIAKYVRHWDT